MIYCSYYSVLGSWVEGLKLDTADTSTVDGGDLDVTLVTPRGRPGVSDDVVLLTVLGTIADSGDGVVEVGTALLGVEDTTGVHLEDGLVGLDGDGDWLLGDGGLQSGDGSGWDVLVGSNTNLTLGGIELAGTGLTVSGGVWVGGLELLEVGLEVGEGVGLPSTIASIGGLVAGDDLLLGEGEELAGLEEVSTLNSAGGGEGPAGTALSLVLNWVDGTLLSPVDLNIVGLWEGLVVSWELTGLTSVTEESLVLEVGPGGHEVVSDGEVGLLSVDLVDLGILLGEKTESEVVLLFGSEVETVSGDVLNEGLLDLHGDWLFAELGVTEVGGGFAEFVHCK